MSSLTATIATSQKTLSRADAQQLRVLALSSSLLTDRMLLYSDFLPTLEREAEVNLWATSANNDTHQFLPTDVVERFPAVKPFKEFPYNYLRRFNELVWDYRLRPPSRQKRVERLANPLLRRTMQAMTLPAKLLAALGVEDELEKWVEKKLLSYPRSEEAAERLQAFRPDVLLTTGTFRYEEPAVAAAAKSMGIPTLALITSWDNPSTKNRMVFRYDGYLVWSEQMKRDLHQFFPYTQQAPTHIIGAPQFDVFFQERFRQPREEFCAQNNLRPDLPIILYALGSPNFLKEHHGAIWLAERIARGELGNVQMIVRPHPLFDNGQEAALLRNFGPRVVVQRTGQSGAATHARSQDEQQIRNWVNTFRHASVVVNLSSTVAVDAALCDKPVVNLDYDPEPGQPNQELVKEVNHVWTHFKPLAESGGLWMVNSPEEKLEAVKTYLAQPELHREKRRWVAEYVCGYLDGRSGERMARALLEYGQQRFLKRAA